MALAHSSNNPFRDPTLQVQTPAHTGSNLSPTQPVTPQLTGALNSTNTGSSANAPAPNAPNPTPPPLPARHSPELIIPEDAPPPYAAGPNVNQGETRLELGPRRPFQQAPPVQQQQWTGGGPPMGAQYTGASSSSSWSSYPGQSRPPPPPQQNGQWAPPPGPPPLPARPPENVSDFAKDFYASGSQQASSPSSSSAGPSNQNNGGPPDDGRPTTQPVPGHPLLNNGRLLVYPKGYTCWKCNNIGYKQNDPSHPCRKCWQKYAKPFSGPLTYASFDTGDQTLQKPLPKLRPPQHSAFHPPPGPPPPQQQWHPPRPDMSYGMPGAFPSRFGAPPPHVRQISAWAPPPPGGVVYQPGDPRIGGRPCWRCDATGTIDVFIFETEKCPVCGGIGRLF